MASSSSLSLLLLVSLHILIAAQFPPCNICNKVNRTISKPGLVIVTGQLSSTKGNWTCREMDEAGKSGNFSTAQCRSAVFLGTLYCGCLDPPSSPTPIISSPKCELCGSNQVITYPNKTLSTPVGILSCSEIIKAALNGFFPPSICPRFNRSQIIQDCGCLDLPPTSSPTRKPTPSPTRKPSMTTSPEIPKFCISGENKVLVQHKGIVRVKDLKIGDMVSIGDGKFSRVYSFGHHQPHTDTDYLQIHVNGTQHPLEITKQHMVFVDQRGAVPASTVMVGDKLVLTKNGLPTAATAAVTQVLQVRRAGAYAPFTESGLLMVSDVLTSSYVSMQKDSKSFTVAGIEVASMQWLAHASQAPHRMVCRVSSKFCDTESYTEDGISQWVYGPFLAAEWLMNQNVGVMLFLGPPVALILFVLSCVESIFHSMTLVSSILMVTFVIATNRTMKTKSG